MAKKRRKRTARRGGYQPKPLLSREVTFHNEVYAVCQQHFQAVLDDTFDTVAFVTDIGKTMKENMSRIAVEVIEQVLKEEWEYYAPFTATKSEWRMAFLERYGEILEPYLEAYQGELASQNAQMIIDFPHLPTRAEYLCGIERIQNIAITETTWALGNAQIAISSVYNEVLAEVQKHYGT